MGVYKFWNPTTSQYEIIKSKSIINADGTNEYTPDQVKAMDDKIGILNGAGATKEKANKVDLDSHLAENVTTHNVSRGVSSFKGNNQEVIIAHGLEIKPTSAYAFPIVNPEGYLGEVWIRIDETNLYIGNSGSFTGAMSWTAIG